MQSSKFIALVVSATMLSACTEPDGSPGRGVTKGGALLGGMLGSSVGSSLDNADRSSYDRASQDAMETGYARKWENRDTGNRGSIRPSKRYRNDEGVYCREYTQTIIVDGRSHKGHGTACRDEDGTWQIVE